MLFVQMRFPLLFALSVSAIAINNSPANILQPAINTSSLLTATTTQHANCFPSRRSTQGTVRAIDCLDLFTFILATTPDTTLRQTYLPAEPERPPPLGFHRTVGTCDFTVVNNGLTAATASMDEIIRSALGILASCFFDNKSDLTHCKLLPPPQ